MRPVLIAVITGLLTVALVPAVLVAQAQPAFYVDGRFLYDGCGERVILRGTNVMTLYWDSGGATTFPQLAQTGANCARIFWHYGQSASHLDLTIQNCVDNGMIPMVGVWQATGVWSELQNCVNWWTSPEVVAVIQKHEKYFLLNIANEAGDGSQSDSEWLAAYQSAITQIRNAGIICPLVIDPAGWGRDESYIFNSGQALVAHDPLHSIIFDWHLWDSVPEGGTQQRIKNAIDTSIDLDLCMVIGEFSYIGVDISRLAEWEYLIQYATESDIGWLPWVWWCCGTPAGGHSVVYDKIYGHWNKPWGEEVAVANQYSIFNTAVRPASIVNGSCSSPTYNAREPLPADTSTDVDRKINIHWFAGHGATSHDVYFGADANAVAAADRNSHEFRGNTAGTTFDLGTLPYNTTYYWAVDAVNDTSTFGHGVWSFTTGKWDPNITYDRADNDYKTYGSSSLSFNHTLGASDNRIVVVGIAAEDESAANLNINYVTYNGVNMTLVPGSTATVGTSMLQRTDLYYILESQLPQPGTYNVYVKRAGSCNESGGGAISLFNVAQQPPEAAAVNSASGVDTITTSITTLTNNAWLVDVVGRGSEGTISAGSEGAGMLRRWLREGGYSDPNSSSAGATMPAPSAGPVNVRWNCVPPAASEERTIVHSVAAFAPAPPTYRLGDLNHDHAVDWLDVGVFAGQWLDTGGCPAQPDCADLNGSGRVDFRDFALMGQNWGM